MNLRCINSKHSLCKASPFAFVTISLAYLQFPARVDSYTRHELGRPAEGRPSRRASESCLPGLGWLLGSPPAGRQKRVGKPPRPARVGAADRAFDSSVPAFCQPCRSMASSDDLVNFAFHGALTPAPKKRTYILLGSVLGGEIV